MAKTLYVTLVRHSPHNRAETRMPHMGGIHLTEEEFDGARRKGLALKRKYPGSEFEFLTSPNPRAMQTAYGLSTHLVSNTKEKPHFEDLDDAYLAQDVPEGVVEKLQSRRIKITPNLNIPRQPSSRGNVHDGFILPQEIKDAFDQYGAGGNSRKSRHLVLVSHAEIISPLLHELTKINSDVRYSMPSDGVMSKDTLPIPGKRQEGQTTYFGGIGIVNTTGSRQYNTKNRITAELDQSFGMLEHLTFRINKRGVTLFFRGKQIPLPKNLVERLKFTQ